MRTLIILGFLFGSLSIKLSAQDTIPHVEGKINISIEKGTIECDVTLSNMPKIDDYYVRLNAGMNLRYIKNAEAGMKPLPYDRSLQDTLSSGESLAYYIPAHNRSKKYLPHSIRFNYGGMFPVVEDSSSVGDWRGNIAFNGKTLRADGIQSAWCPILYDVEKDKRYENVTYDLDITCGDCEMIYLNGSTPVAGQQARLKSSSPQDLTLFAGNYASAAVNGAYFLNSDASREQLNELGKILQSYKSYLQKKTGIEYKGQGVYIETTPVSKNNSWLFASYPTIVKVGWDDGMKTFQSKTDGPEFLTYMAHELSHYYFGKVRSFNSEIGDMISEGFAEFLAMDITHRLISDSFYREILQRKVREMRNFTPMPIAQIRSGSDYKDRELYVYYFAPIIFSAIEKEIGENKMQDFMKTLLQAPVKFTNYEFLKKALVEAVNNKTLSDSLCQRYFISPQPFENAVHRLGIGPAQNSASSDEKDTVKTFYYFFFARPLIDAGSSQNHVITHTEVQQITCTQAELSKLANPVFERFKAACANEGGCSLDFNTYDSKEQADAALVRWLNRHNKNGNLEVKILR